jgi:hypothetical protein
MRCALSVRAVERVYRQITVRCGKDVRTTMIYTHVLNKGGQGVRSQLDRP